jgi:hypothetical protein
MDSVSRVQLAIEGDTRETGVEMKREDIDLSGAFNDGFEPPSFWRIIWDWLREKIKNCIGLPADDRHRVRTVDKRDPLKGDSQGVGDLCRGGPGARNQRRVRF